MTLGGKELNSIILDKKELTFKFLVDSWNLPSLIIEQYYIYMNYGNTKQPSIGKQHWQG